MRTKIWYTRCHPPRLTVIERANALIKDCWHGSWQSNEEFLSQHRAQALEGGGIPQKVARAYVSIVVLCKHLDCLSHSCLISVEGGDLTPTISATVIPLTVISLFIAHLPRNNDLSSQVPYSV